MTILTQHRPNFVDSSFAPEIGAASSFAELEDVKWVFRWSQDEGFHRFSQTEQDPGHWLLMAEFDDGFRWYVVAHYGAQLADVPLWGAKYREKPQVTP